MGLLTTSQMRAEFAPPCTNDRTVLHLHGDGRISVRNFAVDAFRALNACLVQADYRTRRADTGAYNCRRITGGKGYSPHAYGTAADINWTTNPYGKTLVTDMPVSMTAAIKAIRTNSGARVFGWGGDYKSVKDAMHWEVACTLADLASGIDPRTVPGGFTPPATDRPIPATRQQVPGTWRFGDRGAPVHFLQSMLVLTEKYHHAKLATDGFYGADTRLAVAEFQRFGRGMGMLAGSKNLLAVDGIVGPQTSGALSFWVRASLGK